MLNYDTYGWTRVNSAPEYVIHATLPFRCSCFLSIILTNDFKIFFCSKVLPKLSSQTLHALLTSDELWVPNEEKRYVFVNLTTGAIIIWKPSYNKNSSCHLKV
jgi:hypothetical protein